MIMNTYLSILSSANRIASATTTQWGNEIHSIVQFFAMPFALVLTGLEVVVDFFERPLQTAGLLKPPVRQVPLQPQVVIEAPVKPVSNTQPLRRRITRKRGLAEIKSLVA